MFYKRGKPPLHPPRKKISIPTFHQLKRFGGTMVWGRGKTPNLKGTKSFVKIERPIAEKNAQQFYPLSLYMFYLVKPLTPPGLKGFPGAQNG